MVYHAIMNCVIIKQTKTETITGEAMLISIKTYINPWKFVLTIQHTVCNRQVRIKEILKITSNNLSFILIKLEKEQQIYPQKAERVIKIKAEITEIETTSNVGNQKFQELII